MEKHHSMSLCTKKWSTRSYLAVLGSRDKDVDAPDLVISKRYGLDAFPLFLGLQCRSSVKAPTEDTREAYWVQDDTLLAINDILRLLAREHTYQ